MSGMQKVVFVAKHSFTATREDEVTLRVGDVVEVIADSGDWWSGNVGGASGVFPACYVQQMRSTGSCTVIYPFTPRQEDEVKLVVGERVEIFGEVEAGTWAKGKVGGRVGLFPLSYVKQDSTEVEASTPVQMRKISNSKARAAVRSVGPMTVTLFDPEDEPVGPLAVFGSLSDKMSEAPVTGDSEDQVKGGFFSKLKHSLGGRSSTKRRSVGGRQRLSSGSYLETQSVCSPAMARRNSISGFFGKMFTSSSRSSSKFSLQSLDEVQEKSNRLSRSWDQVCKIIPKKKEKEEEDSNRIAGIEANLGDITLYPGPAHQATVASLDQVWQEVSFRVNMLLFSRWISLQVTESSKSNDLGDVTVGKVWSGSNLARSDSGFGGSEDQSQTIEEPFGPLEDLTDAVFEDMFSPSKRTTCAVAEPPLHHQGLTRNETATNPFLRRKRPELHKDSVKVEPVTEL